MWLEVDYLAEHVVAIHWLYRASLLLEWKDIYGVSKLHSATLCQLQQSLIGKINQLLLTKF